MGIQSICMDVVAAFPVDEAGFSLFVVLSMGSGKSVRFMMATNDRAKMDENKGAIKKLFGGGGGRPGTFQGSVRDAKVFVDVFDLLEKQYAEQEERPTAAKGQLLQRLDEMIKSIE